MSQTIPAIHIGLMSLKEGQIVGERYQLDRLIAQGGFGAVWRAKDLESGREVAVKFPRPDLASNNVRVRFESELRVLRLLPKHPHIVEFLTQGVSDGAPFLVMELLPNSLHAWLDQHRKESLKTPLFVVAPLFAQICKGVGAAHRLPNHKPIVHRDINPNNIMIETRPSGELCAKVLDFGVARIGCRATTATGEQIGTPGYMSPEQAHGLPDQQSPRSDVFCLGILAIEMLTLVSQLTHSQLHCAIYSTQHHDQLESLLASLRPDDVPPSVWKVISCATNPQPELRYADANELGQAWWGAWWDRIPCGAPKAEPTVATDKSGTVMQCQEEAVTQPFAQPITQPLEELVTQPVTQSGSRVEPATVHSQALTTPLWLSTQGKVKHWLRSFLRV
jgi:serine/threonine protein kinase